MTEGEMRLLARKYRDPVKAGLCNYVTFHEDITEKQNGTVCLCCSMSETTMLYKTILHGFLTDIKIS